jgi:hypothetical protein
MKPNIAAALVAVGFALAACPGAQVKGASGDVNVTVRRIDVVSADFDKMKVNLIVAVENGTSSDVDAEAKASIAVVGEGKDEEAEDAAAEKKEGDDDKTVPEEAAKPAASPIDGARHSGSGGGTAAAYNTSELPIPIELPLPSDPALLEQVLSWPKMLVDIDGSVRVGLATKPLTGTRAVAPPRLPEVRLKESQVASVDGGTAGTGFFTLILDNKNPFPVTVDKMTWTIAIKDKVLTPSTGQTSVEHDSVPASAVSEYSDEVQVNEAAFGKDLKALLKNPTVPYVIEGSYEVRGIKKTFRFAGDMKFAR